ncbi:MBL fold metallo-hydrolase [Undibacter mobilis]|uniref:MBL fold metallo-hydrolase n=1 Tax=Undibacter mobilis TaxID=2292256 RepID=A0A371BE85_9BRAD|nr:MBL fold metallo-hydrolase [Undibacter mobilis]RDV05880.1 MBL fold metallo-hydrolase [Undibacter mobilis]
MLELSRRNLMTGGAAAAAAVTTAPLILAAANAQAAGGAVSPLTGVYAYKMGDAEIIQVFDGARTFPIPDNFIVNLSKEETAKAYAAQYMPAGQLTITFSPLIVKVGGKTIAIDTGNGLGANAATKGAVGNARHSMAAAGIDPKSVDIVLISHFHSDHINGLKNADGSPAYPNAQIMVPSVEQAFWTDESNASKANGPNKGNFAGVKKTMDGLKTTPFDAGKEVAPGITAVATPGHTPGHTSFVIASGNKSVMVQGDVTNHPGVFMPNPGWHLMFDNDAQTAEATRRKVYDMASADKMPIIGYHFPFPSAGFVEKSGTGYRLVQVHALS